MTAVENDDGLFLITLNDAMGGAADDVGNDGSKKLLEMCCCCGCIYDDTFLVVVVIIAIEYAASYFNEDAILILNILSVL